MKLFLIRHGIAEDLGAQEQKADFDRELTEKGIYRLQQVFKKSKQHLKKVSTIYTSPRVRAQQTAEVAYKYLPDAELEIMPELDFVTPVQICINQMRKFDTEQSYLLVGHNPHLTELMHLLLGMQSVIPFRHKKGGIIELEGDLNQGFILEQLLTPKFFC